LALAQAELVAGALREAEAGLEVELVPVSTSGDEGASRGSVGEPGDKSRFVKEIGALGGDVRHFVSPRVAARLLKLIADGNKYAAGVTSLGDKDVRIIIREIYQDPRNYGKVSFPMAAKSTDLRPYTKGTLIREEMDLEDDLEDDEEDEEIEDLDRVLPPESTTDEAFEDELDEADEA